MHRLERLMKENIKRWGTAIATIMAVSFIILCAILSYVL